MIQRSHDERRALALLNAVAREPSPTAVRAFDEFFYPLIVAYIRKRHRAIGSERAPSVERHQLDEAAHMTALIGLRRARASARSAPMGAARRMARSASRRASTSCPRRPSRIADAAMTATPSGPGSSPTSRSAASIKASAMVP